MTIRALLTQTCTIQDKTAGDADGFGHSEFTWTDTAEDVPCRLYGYGFGVEKVQEKEVGMQNFLLDLLPDQAISEASRVVHEDGNTYRVQSVRVVAKRRGGNHHKIANLGLVE